MLCQHCRTTFSATRKDAKYCSPACRKAANRAAGKSDDLGAAYGETVMRERKLTAEDEEVLAKLIKGKGPGVPGGWGVELPRDEYPLDGTSGTYGEEW